MYSQTPVFITTYNNDISYNRNTMLFHVLGIGGAFESYKEAIKAWKKFKAQKIYVIYRISAIGPHDLFFSTREKAEQYVKEYCSTPTSIEERLLDMVE